MIEICRIIFFLMRSTRQTRNAQNRYSANEYGNRNPSRYDEYRHDQYNRRNPSGYENEYNQGYGSNRYQGEPSTRNQNYTPNQYQGQQGNSQYRDDAYSRNRGLTYNNQGRWNVEHNEDQYQPSHYRNRYNRRDEDQRGWQEPYLTPGNIRNEYNEYGQRNTSRNETPYNRDFESSYRNNQYQPGYNNEYEPYSTRNQYENQPYGYGNQNSGQYGNQYGNQSYGYANDRQGNYGNNRYGENQYNSQYNSSSEYDTSYDNDQWEDEDYEDQYDTQSYRTPSTRSSSYRETENWNEPETYSGTGSRYAQPSHQNFRKTNTTSPRRTSTAAAYQGNTGAARTSSRRSNTNRYETENR